MALRLVTHRAANALRVARLLAGRGVLMLLRRIGACLAGEPAPEPSIRSEWVGRSDPYIAEAAEALGLPTTRVLTTQYWPLQRMMIVLYNPDPDDPEDFYRAVLDRDESDILTFAAPPRHLGHIFVDRD